MRTSSYPYLASQTPFPGESGDKKVVEPKKDRIIMMVKTQGDAWSLLRPPFSLPPPCHCCLHSLMYSNHHITSPNKSKRRKQILGGLSAFLLPMSSTFLTSAGLALLFGSSQAALWALTTPIVVDMQVKANLDLG